MDLPDKNPRLFAYILAVIPAVGVIKSVFDPLPHGYRPGVEVAGWFQMLAIVRDGTASYTYLTPAESSAGLHLHSLLSAPIYIFGIQTAGRVVSLLAALVAAIGVAHLATEHTGFCGAVVAPALLWIQPLFLRLSVSWMPEALGIALTVGAVVGAHQWLETANRYWLFVSGVCVVLGVWNHTWEASIGLPIIVLFLSARRYKATVAILMTTIVALGLNFAVRALQPVGHDLTRSYSVLTHGHVLFSTEWLLHGGFDVWRPWLHSITLTVPVSLVAFVVSFILAVRTQRQLYVLLAGWLASGLAILVVLPRGWVIHEYYAWALVSPLAISGAVLWRAVLDRLPSWRLRLLQCNITAEQTLSSIVVVLLIVSIVGYGWTIQSAQLDRDWAPAEDGYTWGPKYPSKKAGEQIQKRQVDDPAEITFVGPWTEDAESADTIRSLDAARVLIYSGVLVKTREFDGPGTPRFVDNRTVVKNCRVRVVWNASRRVASVERCDISSSPVLIERRVVG